MQDTGSQVVDVQRIFLTGLPGSGKTTIGYRIADLLGWNFVDTDDVIAERIGMATGKVLAEYGEPRFRHIESEILHELANSERIVISTGGGTVISEANRKFMREHGLTVYLQTSVAASWKRMQESSAPINRPLIAGGDGLQRLHNLYATRQKWYEEAIIHIDTEECAETDLASRLVELALARGYQLR
jgi:shikimate kinase